MLPFSPRIDNIVVKNIWKGSTTVPLDFLGMHTRWPKTGSAPSYAYKVTRNHDYPTSASHGWYSVHTADGVFNWTDMDQWVNSNYAAGHTLVYMVYGTPSWLATSATTDPYTVAGGSSPPSNLAKLGEFVTALMTRYNGDGTRRIKYVECWNEPPMDGLDVIKSYFIGTNDQLGAMTRTIAQAARAVDPGVKILSPGFFKGGLVGPLVSAYLNANDGAGGHVRDWLDGVGFHPYHWITEPNEYFNFSLYGTEASFASLFQGLVDGGLPANFPIYGTETGYLNAGTTNGLTGAMVAANMTDAKWIEWNRRHAAVCAAYGAKHLIYYRGDNLNVGTPDSNAAVAAAFQDIQNNLPGATITSIDKMLLGQYRVTTDRGTLFW